MTLPTLDLSVFTDGGSDTDRNKFSSDLLSSLSKHGFVKLVNHGIPDYMVSKLFQWNRSFFALAREDLASIAHKPGPEPQRGWSRVGSESSASLYRKGLLKAQVSEDLKDAREHFDMGAKQDPEYRNRWPDDAVLPGFRLAMEGAFEAFERVSETIMKALELAFGLPSGAFLDMMTREANASELRLNHYPAIEVNELTSGAVSRIWPHFDLGVITLLFQDRVGGLEYENRLRPGTFVPIECGAPSEMIVNISETLQRWTNDVLPAGLHRVNLPKSVIDDEINTVPERYSIAYFCKADRLASVGPLKQFLSEESSKYRDMRAIDYHQERLQSAY